MSHEARNSPMTEAAYIAIRESGPFRTILIDPPYRALRIKEIAAIPVRKLAYKECHLYAWCQNDLAPVAFKILGRWGFTFQASLICYTGRKGTQASGRAFHNVTEMLLFAVKGETPLRAPQEDFIELPRKPRSGTPPIVRKIIEECSYGPYLELFAKRQTDNWTCWRA